MSSYLQRYVDKSKTPQSAPLNKDHVKNRAGGYVYKIDDMAQLKRFLILGTCGGSYYASEREMTSENIDNVAKILDADGVRAINTAVEISEAGRAPKNDQAILLLALASIHKNPIVRSFAFKAVPKVCRIGTHLYQFCEFRKTLRGGWGRGMRDAIGGWMNCRSSGALAVQMAKYKQREGWSARDLLRKAHPKASSDRHDAVFKWVVSKGEKLSEAAPAFLHACNEVAGIEGSSKDAIRRAVILIQENMLPREVLPTGLLNSTEVWEALLPHMGVTALIRNLGKMTSIGLLKPNSKATVLVAQKLEDPEFVQRGRIHPLNVLGGSMVYGAGKGIKGSLSWGPVSAINGALEDAFYHSFGSVEPTGKRTMLGIDVSGSMSWSNGIVMNVPGMNPAIIAACMSMVTLRTEGAACYTMGFSNVFKDLGITKRDSLREVMRKTRDHNFGGTDCAVPMLWSLKNRVEADTFIVYTDNESWCGEMHASEALRKYRQHMGIDARLIACGITATNYSVADPSDENSLDVSGFDSATPSIISGFARGDF